MMQNVHAVSPEAMGEREFKELADHAPVMIWRSRPDKLCDWFNRPWQEYVGRPQEALVGFGWAEDVHPDDFEGCVATYTRAFDARERFTMPYRLRRHDGVYRWFLDNGAPYFRDGRFAGYFGSCIDITEQRELQEHQQVLLAELNHRVKNNLQLVLSFLQLSKLRAQGDEARQLLQGAIQRIHSVGAVQDELHRNVGGTVDLGEYLPSLARKAVGAEPSGQATLAVDAEPLPAPFQLASTLGLMVNELVHNAVKHGGAPATVSLRIRRTDASTAEIVVRDAGPGFPPAMIEGAGQARSIGLLEALARRARATLTRANVDGAEVRVRFPVGDPAASE